MDKQLLFETVAKPAPLHIMHITLNKSIKTDAIHYRTKCNSNHMKSNNFGPTQIQLNHIDRF